MIVFVAGLKRLDLSYNSLLTALPVGLCSLVRLEELDLCGCRLTALPKGIGRLARQKKLNLSATRGFPHWRKGCARCQGWRSST